jgi:hypothetical protein
VPDSHRLETRPLAVVDTSESLKTGHWYEATRPLGTVRSELLEAVGWLSSDPERQVPTRGPDGAVHLVRAASKPPNVLFILPKEGTARWRQWGGVLNYLETALVGRKALSKQHLEDAQDYLTETEDYLTQLASERDSALAALEKERDTELPRLREEREATLSSVAAKFAELRERAHALADASRQYADMAIPPGVFGDPNGPGRSERVPIPTAASADLVLAVEAARECAREYASASGEFGSRIGEVERRWSTRASDTAADFGSRLKAARQRRDSAQDRVNGAMKQDRHRVFPGAHGQVRAFLDRELLDAARVASDEMRKSPGHARALAEAHALDRRLSED